MIFMVKNNKNKCKMLLEYEELEKNIRGGGEEQRRMGLFKKLRWYDTLEGTAF